MSAIPSMAFQEHLNKYYLHIIIHLFYLFFLLESDLKASN